MTDDADSRDDRDRARDHTEPKRTHTDNLVRTQHVLSGTDWQLEYEATAGTVVVSHETVEEGRAAAGKAQAEVFVTSYIATGGTGLDTSAAPDGDGDRPVVFAFNGGPGSSSVWLHLGLLGPRRVVSGDVDDRQSAPFALADNTESLLRHADLVFIDPMTTGYTRAAEGASPGDFHGYSGDRDLVGEVIRLWLGRHRRWLSPKYLAGESYGTTRAAALAGTLATRHGIALNGLILISTVLDFAPIRFYRGNDLPFVHYLPTYAATAAYHDGLDTAAVEERIEAAREFAAGPYADALARGARMPADERRAVAERLSELIGLDADYLERARLRVEHTRFFAELRRRDGVDVGRLDTRFSMPAADLNEAAQQVDPAHMFIFFPYTAAINQYVRAELGFTSDLEYEILTDRVQPWSYKEFEGRSVSVTEELSAALRVNPDLRVYVAFGYYDGATPFSASEYVLDHLDVPDEVLADRFDRHYYPAGHMMYVHEPSRLDQSRHIAEFVTGRGA